MSQSRKRILITVGTTEFQELIQYTDSEQFLKLVQEIDQKKINEGKISFQNFEILSQIGNKGLYIPKNSTYIRISDNISQIYSDSDFIICHGGAGTLLQNLHNGKKIISIANDTLAGNHQVQLIKKLSSEGYLLGFENVRDLRNHPGKIKDFLRDKIEFRKYEKVNKSILNDIIFGEGQ